VVMALHRLTKRVRSLPGMTGPLSVPLINAREKSGLNLTTFRGITFQMPDRCAQPMSPQP